eukprot:3936609-Alexandrium_andersonii.AAC.1
MSHYSRHYSPLHCAVYGTASSAQCAVYRVQCTLCSTAQYSTVPYSVVLYRTAQYSTVKCSAV